MQASPTPLGLALCGLPQAWANQAAWTILDTDWGTAQSFVHCWLAWRQDPQRPRMLHYVGITSQALVRIPCEESDGAAAPLWHLLVEQCADRGEGVHRLVFEGGCVSLTLCVGAVHAMLKEQVFQADTAWVTRTTDPWLLQWVARHCKRGTRFCMQDTLPATDATHLAVRELLRQAGFVWDAANDVGAPLAPIAGAFNPRWEIATRRNLLRHTQPTPARCAVVGAGISGASVAHALALRGWQVTVFEQERAPASAASGVPVGLAVPHVSIDDSPLSRLSRRGTRLLLQQAHHLLAIGADWAPSGAWERKPDTKARWHPHAAWIKPAALVHAWLKHPRITFAGLSPVSALHRHDTLWQLMGPHGQALGAFEQVVIANAMGCKALLRQTTHDGYAVIGPDLKDKLNALQALHGTLSHGIYGEHLSGLPTTPVNGNGCFFPAVPGPNGPQWATGSTFETDPLVAADQGAQHAINLERLHQLLPELGNTLAQALDRGPVSLWSSTRCVSHDRLPLVGAIDKEAGSGLWLSVGMGARGLSFAALCAELLVAQLAGEPLPMELSLARHLDVHRLRRKRVPAMGHHEHEN